MKPNFGLRSALAATAALCASSLLMADSEQQTTRPVIRGSGSDVTIVYQSKLHPKLSWSAPAPAAPPAAPAAAGPVEEAVKMKTAGATDQAVVAFLKKNEVDMPDVVDADTIRDLRKAGAGDSVVALVSRYSAIDIGATGEGTAAMPQDLGPQDAYTGAFPDLANLGYPFYGSSGGGFVGNRFRRFGPRVTPHKNVFFHFHAGQTFPMPRPLPVQTAHGANMSRRTGTGPAMGGGRRTR